MKKFIYSGKKRREISFPLGGIGTGCIGLLGNGALGNFEVQNHQNKYSANQTFFAIKAEENGKLTDARILQSDGEFSGMGSESFTEISYGVHGGYGYGPKSSTMEGFPHFPKCDFVSYFPFAELNFKYEKFPADIKMTSFNPFIPLNDTDSGIPAGFFEFEISNTSQRCIDYTVCSVLESPFTNSRNKAGCTESGTAYIYMDSSTPVLRSEDGSMCIATDGQNISFQEYFYRGSWFDSLKMFWNDFTLEPVFKNRTYEDKTTKSCGVLASHFTLSPGESKTVKFLISWYFPYSTNYYNPIPREKDETNEEFINKNSWRNYYAQYFESSIECASYCFAHWTRLKSESLKFAETLLGSTLPDSVLEAVTNNLCVLKSPVCLRLDDGSFWGWEGSKTLHGSCPGSCIHVWNYAYALPYLFPGLERSMTRNHIKYNMDEHGGVGFRVHLPITRDQIKAHNDYISWVRVCADGQLGLVIKSYRDFKISGDEEELIEHWYDLCKVLDYCFDKNNPYCWDPDMTGVMSGRQHNTLDTELYSPNSWIQGLYLAALKAGHELAKIVGDKRRAETYLELFNKGKKWTEENLWNGRYYCQKIDLTDKSLVEKFGTETLNYYFSDETGEIKYQIGEGSSIDQILGQWHADLSGLGEIFAPDRVKSAVKTLYDVNFIKNMRDFVNPCRLFCYDEDGGCVICTYPEGTKVPKIPVPYAEECMTGFEYEAASLMIMHGMVNEGLELVSAIRKRYDGEYRNPFSEIECGSDYARSMASYCLLTALSGFQYDAYNKHIGFAPLSDYCPTEFGDTYRCFFCVEAGYGYVEEGIDYIEVNMVKGSLDIRSFAVPRTPRLVQYGGRNWRFTDKGLCAELDTNLIVTPDKKLTILIDIK